jgi:hypothetical protein
MGEPGWLTDQSAGELGERFRALINDGGEPPLSPVGWEEAGVELAAMLINKQRETMDPLMRMIMTRQIGAYVGELLRRECGGHWLALEDGSPYLQLANQLTLNPLALVDRHFDEGRGADIHAFYKVYRALGTLSGEELSALGRGELKLEERFPELEGLVTLASSQG